jgi:hypothetical protein
MVDVEKGGRLLRIKGRVWPRQRPVAKDKRSVANAEDEQVDNALCSGGAACVLAACQRRPNLTQGLMRRRASGCRAGNKEAAGGGAGDKEYQGVARHCGTTRARDRCGGRPGTTMRGRRARCAEGEIFYLARVCGRAGMMGIGFP